MDGFKYLPSAAKLAVIINRKKHVFLKVQLIKKTKINYIILPNIDVVVVPIFDPNVIG